MDRGSMDADIDHDLTPEQWETLKALRAAVPECRGLNRWALAQLIALDLAAMRGNLPVITAGGRKVLVRGSCRLLDLAA
jgi:hypothetical protein